MALRYTQTGRIARTAVCTGLGLVAGPLLGASAAWALGPCLGGTIVTVPRGGSGTPAAVNGFKRLLISSACDQQAASLLYQPLV